MTETIKTLTQILADFVVNNHAGTNTTQKFRDAMESLGTHYRFDIRVYGATGVPGHDDSAAIIAACAAVPPEGGVVWIPWNSSGYQCNSVIAPHREGYSNMVIMGETGPFAASDGSGFGSASRIYWGGTANAGTFLNLVTESGGTKHRCRGHCVYNLEIDCQNLIGYGLGLYGGYWCEFRRVFVLNPTSYGFAAGCVTGIAETTSTQRCVWEDCLVDNVSTTNGGGFILSGVVDGDVSFSQFYNCKATHKGTGHGFNLIGTDGNTFFDCQAARNSVGGYGFVINDAVAEGGGNIFYNITAGAGGFAQLQSAGPNYIFNYNNGNGEPDPVISSNLLHIWPPVFPVVEKVASGLPQSFTTSYVDVAGTTKTITDPGLYRITVSADVSVVGAGDADQLLQVVPWHNAGQDGKALLFQYASPTVRTSAGLSSFVTLALNDTMKLRIIKGGGTGASTLNQAWLDLEKIQQINTGAGS